jgi:hypothetical protein
MRNWTKEMAEAIYLDRIDKLLDTFKHNNIEIDNKALISYTKLSKKYLATVEDIVDNINEHKYLLVKFDIDIIKVPIKQITYTSTYKYITKLNEYIDVYTIEYENGLTETISSIEIISIFKLGGVKRNISILGINEKKLKEYILKNEK